MYEQLGVSDEQLTTWASLARFGAALAGMKVLKGEAVFPRIDIKAELPLLEQENEAELMAGQKNAAAPAHKKEAPAQKEEEPIIGIEDFQKLRLRTALVLSCEKVEKSDKLLKFRLKVGEEERTVLSGIAAHYTPEQLVGKTLVLLSNLAPRKIRGVESQGMLLCAAADDDAVLRLLTVDGSITDGAGIS